MNFFTDCDDAALAQLGVAISATRSELLYLAAHAPTEPQPWFSPVMATPRPLTRHCSDDGWTEYSDWRAAEKACGENYHNPNANAQNEWDAEQKKQRLVQWPVAWAFEVWKTIGEVK